MAAFIPHSEAWLRRKGLTEEQIRTFQRNRMARHAGTFLLPHIKKEDLDHTKDEEPTRLNESLRFLEEKIVESYGDNGMVRLGAGPFVFTGVVVGEEQFIMEKPPRIRNLKVYTDNDAARAAGLSDGDLYRKSTGEVMVTYED